jgi:tetratricopeptide (TPR) repeat protein
MLPATRATGHAEPVVRVMPEEFGENLASMADLARDIGAPMIVINPPIPYRWPAGLQFKIFAHMTDSAGQWVVADPVQRQLERPVAYCLDSSFTRRGKRGDPYAEAVFTSAYMDQGNVDSIETMYAQRLAENPEDVFNLNNLGVLYWRQKKYSQAMEFFHRCLELDSSFNVGRYNLGISLADAGDTARAREVLRQAVDLDYYSLRIKTPYRRELAVAAGEHGAEVIDGPGLFAAWGNERLFIDHCHPTPEGHILLAERLAVVIDSLMRR